MRKVFKGLTGVWLILLMAGLTVFLVSANGGPPEVKVWKALGPVDAPDVHKIPVGSVIVHLPDGSTKVTGPDGKVILLVKDNEVGLISTPAGMAKATHVYQVPSGSFIHGASRDTVEVYGPDGELILTVIDQRRGSNSRTVQVISASSSSYTGWIESAQYGDPEDPFRSFKYFYAEWVVPMEPINSWIDDDMVYLFNGIQGSGANEWEGKTVIFQPVVGFNGDHWVPGNPLDGKVWIVYGDCGIECFFYQTPPVDVAVGDLISGELKYNNSTKRWRGLITNKSKGSSIGLETDLLGVTNQRVVVALEGYNLETNSDLFGTTDFVNMKVQKLNGDYISPSWRKFIHAKNFPGFTGLDVVIFNAQHVRLKTAR